MARTELSPGTSSDVVGWRCEQLRVNGFPPSLGLGSLSMISESTDAIAPAVRQA